MQKFDLSCGAAALATLLNSEHGERLSERQVAIGLMKRGEYIDNPHLVQYRQGFSLLDLKRYVATRGYAGVGYGNLTWEDLQQLAPVMIPVNILGYNHFVIFQGTERGDVRLVDPAWGNRKMSTGEFRDAWIEYPRLGKVGFVVQRKKRLAQLEHARGEELSADHAASPAPDPKPLPPPQHEAAASPGVLDVDEQAAERALERSLTQTGALLLPWGLAEVQFSMGYARTEDVVSTLVSLDGQAGVGSIESRRDDYAASASVRLGLPFDAQLELSLPYRIVHQSQIEPKSFTTSSETQRTESGVEDLAIGAALTLHHETGALPGIIGRLSWNTGTGDTALGRGFAKVSGGLTLLERQDPLVFVGNVSYEAAFEHAGARPGNQIGLSVAALLAASPETSLSVGLEQVFMARARAGGAEVVGTDVISGVALLGATSTINRHALVSLTGGIGLTKGAPNYLVSLSVPVRFGWPD